MDKLLLLLISAPILLAPWMFGAWEMWWFWPFALLIFLAGAVFGVQQMLRLKHNHDHDDSPDTPPEHRIWLQRQRTLLLLCLPIILYGAWWLTRPVVYMLAERSWLIFATTVLLGSIVTFGLSARQRRLLFSLVIIDLFLLGLYGIVNHAVTNSHIVLWAPAYAQYTIDNRASGSYYCPNHYAGIMELAAGLGIGILLTRRVSLRQRLIGFCLIAMACAAILLSKSRGGGLTLLALFLAALHWGFVNWPRRARWWWRAAALALGGILMSGMLLFADGFTARFADLFRPDTLTGKSFVDARNTLARRLYNNSRSRMYRAAVRGWKTSPVTGIGPGMHGVLWPHFNASSDGDRENFIWPSETNNFFWDYETHSDWLEILEEYGIIGLILVLIPVVYLFRVLCLALRQDSTGRREHQPGESHFTRESMALGGLLCLVAMLFHSLVDFNLQMPGTAWIFSAIVALPLGMMGERRVRARRS